MITADLFHPGGADGDGRESTNLEVVYRRPPSSYKGRGLEWNRGLTPRPLLVEQREIARAQVGYGGHK